MNDTREKIIRSARKIFFEHGYRNTTIEEISSQLGMSKRTIYENFSSKREILEAAVDLELAKFTNRIYEIVGAEKEPLAKLWELYQFSQGIVNLGISATALKDMQNQLPDLWKKILVTREKVLEEFGKVIDEGKKKNVFNPEINTDVIIATLVGSLQATLSSEFLLKSSLSLDEVFSSLFLLFTEGFCLEEKEMVERGGRRNKIKNNGGFSSKY